LLFGKFTKGHVARFNRNSVAASARLAGGAVPPAPCRRPSEASAANEDVLKEFVANTVIAGHFEPAGVVAVTRAQERGYANISIG
jgi:intracellular sulfur oxidation DsrE/DsrF family protein